MAPNPVVTLAAPADPANLVSPLSPDQVRARVLELAAPADQALTDNLTSHVKFIEEVSAYTIFSGGKRLRPALYMLAAAAAGGQGEPRFAAIFEYLHAATLLHDDVIDDAGLRRGRQAANKKYGNAEVILVGDFLFSKSYSLAAEVADHRFIQALTDCTTHMAEGQVLELLATDNVGLTPEGYLEVIVAKTAVLLAAACQMGAIFAGADQRTVEALYDFGMELGVAFQMIDDALDYVGTEHEFGKPVGHDLAEGKITLPFIHTRDASPAAARDLADLLERGKTDPAAIKEAQEMVRQAGGVEETVARAAGHALKAQAVLAPLLEAAAAPRDLETMLGLASYVINRRH